MSRKRYSNKLSEELINQLIEYYNQGYSCNEVANKFKVYKTTVIKYVDTRKVVAMSLKEKRKRAVKHVAKRRRKIKQKAIEYKGGCCQRCGYNKCVGALEFHHLDSNKKDFSVSQRGYSTAWEKVKLELDKCILVCSNCHREIHEILHQST